MGASVLHLQETHGSVNHVDKFLSLISRKFWIFGSFLETPAGGLLSLVAKDLMPQKSDILYTPFAEGRLSRLALTNSGSGQIHWNLHNFGISVPQFSVAQAQINADLAWADADPNVRSVFFVGDFNFPLLPHQIFNFWNLLWTTW